MPICRFSWSVSNCTTVAASYGHMGRSPQVVTKTFNSQYWDEHIVEVELFTWEKLDFIETFKNAFGIL